MPKNVELEKVVVSAMTQYLGVDSGRYDIFLSLVGTGMTTSREDLLRGITDVTLDREYLIGVSFREGAVVGYGYDFRQKPVENVPVRRLYGDALRNARSGSSERVVLDKQEGHFGVYIVRRVNQ